MIVTIGRTMFKCFIAVSWFLFTCSDVSMIFHCLLHVFRCFTNVSLMFHCLIRIFETSNFSCKLPIYFDSIETGGNKRCLADVTPVKLLTVTIERTMFRCFIAVSCFYTRVCVFLWYFIVHFMCSYFSLMFRWCFFV